MPITYGLPFSSIVWMGFSCEDVRWQECLPDAAAWKMEAFVVNRRFVCWRGMRSVLIT